MIREFIMTELFDQLWRKLNLSDEDLKEFQQFLLKDPAGGAIIRNTGGARKIRWDLDNNKGKSCGIRVIYVDFEIHKKLFLLLAYPKSEKDNLTENEKKKIKELVKILAKSISIERVE
jgi:hypothetical protein